MAAGESGIRIEPLYLELTVSDEVQTESKTVWIENLTASEQKLEVSAIGVKSQDTDGNVAFVDSPFAAGTSNTVTFLQFSTSSATLAPGAKLAVQVSAINSQSLSPGGHYGAVVSRFVPKGEAKPEPQVLPGVSTLVLVRKTGGERYHISLSDVDQSNGLITFTFPTSVRLTFSNEGNIHVVPHGTIEITDLFGRLVSKGIINDGSRIVLPESRRIIAQSLYSVAPRLPIMLYHTSIRGTTTPGDVPFFRDFYFIFVHPLALALCVFVFFTLLIVISKLWRRKH
jgi:hypothetical protein